VIDRINIALKIWKYSCIFYLSRDILINPSESKILLSIMKTEKII